MLDKIEEIKKVALQQLDGIDSVKDMEAWRVQYLGKKSPLTQILRSSYSWKNTPPRKGKSSAIPS
jgi:hypothetical protein